MGLKVIHHRTCQAAVTEAGRLLASEVSSAKSPLLLLSGGSSLNAVKIMISRLNKKQLDNLVIGQIDERFVDSNSSDCNWKQIKEVFRGHKKLDPEMSMLGNGEKPNEIASNYSAKLTDLIKKADKSIGLYGIGRDGHIAGMKPGRAAYQFTRFLDGRHVVKYKPPDFIRITTTTEVLVTLDRVVAVACGKDKHQAIADLDKEIPPHIHPAQLLKDGTNAEAHVNVGR